MTDTAPTDPADRPLTVEEKAAIASSNISRILYHGILLTMRNEELPEGAWIASVTRVGVANALGKLLHCQPPEVVETFANELARDIVDMAAGWSRTCPDCMDGKPIEGHG